MAKREHYIRKNTRCRRPRQILFFDCEASIVKVDAFTQEHHFLFGYYLFWRRRFSEKKPEQVEIARFESPEELLQAINARAWKNTTTYIVAHNIVYDIAITSLDKLLEADGWELKSAYAKNNTVIIRLEKDKRRLVLLDNMNLFPGTLEEWAKVVGIEKVPIDWDNPDLNELDKRCKNDVLIMYETHKRWMHILDSEDLGDWKTTIASQAFNTFRHKFMTHKIKIHVDKEAEWGERAAYGGGMVKIMHYGAFPNKTLYKLDVNSMYPYVMSMYDYPAAYIGKIERATLEQLRQLVRVACVIADVTILPDIPAYRRKTKEKVIYPLYQFRTVITTREVERLLNNNGIKEIHAVYIYRKRPIFKSYVEYFYQKRLEAKREGRSAEVKMYKLLLNSLYGKFAARAGSFERCPEWDGLANFNGEVMAVKDGKRIPILFWAGKAYAYTEEESAEDTFVAIAAHVTADARMYLGELIDKAGYKETYYCDTDSLIVSEKGYKRLIRLIDPDKLGKLKDEGADSNAEIWGRKFYKWNGKYVIKGVSTVEIDENGHHAYKELWPTFNNTVRADRAQQNIVKIIKQEIKLSTDIKDGTLGDDGLVIPFYVPPPFDPDPFSLTA